LDWDLPIHLKGYSANHDLKSEQAGNGLNGAPLSFFKKYSIPGRLMILKKLTDLNRILT
jgi:hypothetical protein